MDEKELREELGDAVYHVTREQGTERPFSHPYDQEKREGIYVDVISGEVLFSSKDKFDAGCGWPSFSKPIEEGKVLERRDESHNMIRTEVYTETTHLGHVFPDGPEEMGGLRYCINGSSLRFIPKDKMEELGYNDYIDII